MENEPAPVVPGVPPPPPNVSLKKLWLSLLLPPAAMTLSMIVLNLFPDMLTGRGGDTAFTMLCIVTCLAAIVGWVLFILCLMVRFRGISLGLLILAYPILQVIVVFSIFFVGCLAIFAREGIH